MAMHAAVNKVSLMCRKNVAVVQIPECVAKDDVVGARISCLIEHKENVTQSACRQFISRMGSIMFSDYRLVSNFINQCYDDIDRMQCGRMESLTEVSWCYGGELTMCK